MSRMSCMLRIPTSSLRDWQRLQQKKIGPLVRYSECRRVAGSDQRDDHFA